MTSLTPSACMYSRSSLHLTTFCLQYSPPVVACVCIHLACKWSNWEIPVSTDGKHWWEYVDPTVTLELLDGTCCSPLPPPAPQPSGERRGQS